MIHLILDIQRKLDVKNRADLIRDELRFREI